MSLCLGKVWVIPEPRTQVEAVEMTVADDFEMEPGGSAATRIVEPKDSAACMIMRDNDVAPVEFLLFLRCVLDRKPRIRVRTVTKRK